MTPRISIVMATFNGAAHVAEQIASLLAQTVAPAELVVSDDGSTDDTMAIAARALADAPFPVKLVVNAERKGYRRNFTEAAGLCTAPLIAFCDQDDVWRPDKLAAMGRAFDGPDVLLAYHNATITDAVGRVTGRLYPPGGRSRQSESTLTDPWSFSLGFTQVFRRDLLAFSQLHAMSRDFLFPDERLAHDQWFFFLASCFGRIGFVDEDLVAYRQHAANVFGASSRRLGRFEVLKATLDHSRRQLEARRGSLEARARILSTVAASASHAEARRARAAEVADHYADLARLCAARAAAYDLSVGAKAWAWSRLLAGRRARRAKGLLYLPRHAARDLTFGVILGGLAAAPGSPAR